MIPEGRVAVVSHDAGGAEILSSWIRRNPRVFSSVVSGPAKKIFSEKLDDYFITPLSNAVRNSDWVLTGSGWKSSLEYDAIYLSRKLGKRVVTFLDHWANYRKRFNRNGVNHFPDEIWVGDRYALEIARENIPEVSIIHQVDNPYFKDIQDQLAKYSRYNFSDKKKILYVTEPTSEHALLQEGDKNYWGWTEFDALQYFLENIGKLCHNKIEVITIRPHPAEIKGKYDYFLDQFPDLPININGDEKLIPQITQHQWIVGCNTIPMVIGLINKNKVFCSIPPHGGRCQLPFGEIQHISSLLSA